MKNRITIKILTIFAFFALFGCQEEDEQPNLRANVDYETLTPETEYATFFVDANGKSTVVLTEGQHRLQMFQALNYHSTSNISAGNPIDATTLENMFSNTGNPFYDISTTTMDISGAELNSSPVQLRDAVASSLEAAEEEAVRTKLENDFAAIELASQSLSSTASPGVAGKLGNYLLDAKGIEIAQVIQKSLIGALQLDFIGNELLVEGLTADNSKPVGDENYTQREHNWDVAYGLLTLNPIYLEGSTDAARNTNEFGIGSYLWEYNKAAYDDIYPAFLKGRAAIVNNDRAEYEAQAQFIRVEMEKAIASAALGYLEKWKAAPTDDARRAHAFGEALGFIYSLRFAEAHGADYQFSEEILTNLLDSENGFWDVEAAQINAAADAIKAKFEL